MDAFWIGEGAPKIVEIVMWVLARLIYTIYRFFHWQLLGTLIRKNDICVAFEVFVIESLCVDNVMNWRANMVYLFVFRCLKTSYPTVESVIKLKTRTYLRLLILIYFYLVVNEDSHNSWLKNRCSKTLCLHFEISLTIRVSTRKHNEKFTNHQVIFNCVRNCSCIFR